MQFYQSGHPIPATTPGTVQVVSVGAASTATANPFAPITRVIRIVSTTDCHYVMGDSPVATTSHSYLPAGVVEYLAVQKFTKIAFIQSSSGGTAYVTEDI